MGVTKTEDFTLQQNELSQRLKALAHPARVAILEHLASINSCICGDLVDVLPLSQATVSQHLRELKQAGYIKGTVTGTSVCYCIDAEAWEETRGMINAFFDHFPKNQNCC